MMCGGGDGGGGDGCVSPGSVYCHYHPHHHHTTYSPHLTCSSPYSYSLHTTHSHTSSPQPPPPPPPPPLLCHHISPQSPLLNHPCFPYPSSNTILPEILSYSLLLLFFSLPLINSYHIIYSSTTHPLNTLSTSPTPIPSSPLPHISFSTSNIFFPFPSHSLYPSLPLPPPLLFPPKNSDHPDRRFSLLSRLLRVCGKWPSLRFSMSQCGYKYI